MRIFLAQINPIVGDLKNNGNKIIKTLDLAREKNAEIVVFPEMSICGYPPEDLLLHHSFIEDVEKELTRIIEKTKSLFVLVGLPRKNILEREKPLFNSVAVIYNQKLLGFKDKTLLPTYDVFDERRYFEPGKEQKIFEFKGKKIGVFVCEDIWEHSGSIEVTKYNRDPVKELKELSPDLTFNLSSSPYYFKKKNLRISVCQKAAASLNCPMIFCNQVGANDQLVFDGYSFYVDGKGTILEMAKGFAEDFLLIDTEEKKHPKEFPQDPVEDLYSALVIGVKDYFYKQGFKKAILGLSGGVDSALVACIAQEALGKENVLALSMPSRYSSLASFEDAFLLCNNLGIELKDISIDHTYQVYLDLFSPFFYEKKRDITEENIQARIRGMILMAFSNKFGYIVLSTGNKSEMAMGFCTLYGDMCGGLGVLIDVSKANVYTLCRWINENKNNVIPESILTKAPSAELRENQKDQDTLPPYEIIDAVLEDYIEECLSIEQIVKKRKIGLALVEDVVRKIHLAEYKRRQSPPGIRVTKKSFSKGRNFPIVQKWH